MSRKTGAGKVNALGAGMTAGNEWGREPGGVSPGAVDIAVSCSRALEGGLLGELLDRVESNVRSIRSVTDALRRRPGFRSPEAADIGATLAGCYMLAETVGRVNEIFAKMAQLQEEMLAGEGPGDPEAASRHYRSWLEFVVPRLRRRATAGPAFDGAPGNA